MFNYLIRIMQREQDLWAQAPVVRILKRIKDNLGEEKEQMQNSVTCLVKRLLITPNLLLQLYSPLGAHWSQMGQAIPRQKA